MISKFCLPGEVEMVALSSSTTQKSILSGYENEWSSWAVCPAVTSKGGWSRGSEGEAEPGNCWLCDSFVPGRGWKWHGRERHLE